jgi:hypothetical protein
VLPVTVMAVPGKHQAINSSPINMSVILETEFELLLLLTCHAIAIAACHSIDF